MSDEIDARMAEWNAIEERKYATICADLDDKYAWEMAASPAMLKHLFDLSGWPVSNPVWVDVGHLGTLTSETMKPMTLYVRTSPDGPCETEKVIHEVDLIGDIIDTWGNPHADDSARAAFDRAYAALQGGIDRLRAYEAECLAAQS